MAEQKQDDQLEHTYSSSVRIRDLPEAMNDRERWRERVRNIRAGGMMMMRMKLILVNIKLQL